MNKRKYVIKREDLYKEAKYDFVEQRKVDALESLEPQDLRNLSFNTRLPKKQNQENLQRQGDLIQVLGNNKDQKQSQIPNKDKILSQIKSQNLKSIDQTTQSKIRPTNKPKNKKNPNVSIGFRSSLHQVNNQNMRKSVQFKQKQKPKQKACKVVNKQNETKNPKLNKSIEKVNFSQSLNQTSRSAIQNQKMLKQQQQKPNTKQHLEQEQFIRAKSIISQPINQNIYGQKNKQQLDDQCLQQQQVFTIKKQKQPSILFKQNYIRKIDSQLHYLQKQIQHYESKNKQLQEILTSRQKKLCDYQNQSIQMYKENQYLSDMLRDLEKTMQKKDLQHEKNVLQMRISLKQQKDKYLILQAERDTLVRKKDRLNEEITRLNEVISTRQAQISSQKQKQQFLLEENDSLIVAYEKVKQQLQQVIKITQTERFFNELISKTQDHTERANQEVQTFKCTKCHQSILGNQNSMDQMIKYHLNERFKKHIKTYEEEVKYWKEEIQFMKTQHENEIENIRTVLQCTFQKNLLKREERYEIEIKELKKTVKVQEELIANYKNVIDRKERGKSRQNLEKNQLVGKQSKRHSIDTPNEGTTILKNIETTRSRSYLSDRKVIEEVLADQTEYRPRQANNRAVIKIISRFLFESQTRIGRKYRQIDFVDFQKKDLAQRFQIEFKDYPVNRKRSIKITFDRNQLKKTETTKKQTTNQSKN